MPNISNASDIPIGLGMALAQNSSAMATFSSLSQQEQQQIIQQTHSIQSKEEMQSFVSSFSKIE